MRKLILLGILPSLCWAAFLLLDYLDGRRGTPLEVLFFPVVGFPLFLIPIAFGRLLLEAVKAVGNHLVRRAPAICVVLAAFLALAATWWVSRQFPRPFLLGLSGRVFAAGSAAEFHAAVIVIEQTLKEGESVSGPERLGLGDKRDTWDKLAQVPCLARLGEGTTISRRESSVVFLWGGALVGYYGFEIGDGLPRRGPRRGTTYTEGGLVFFQFN